MHGLGVLCGLGAGVWLGAAEAPTKLVNTGLSPFAISLCMVAGVFTARWSLPTLVKGTRSVFADLAAKPPPHSHRHHRRHVVGGRQYAHGVRHSRRGAGHRLSAVEHQFAGRASSGAGCCSANSGAQARATLPRWSWARWPLWPPPSCWASAPSRAAGRMRSTRWAASLPRPEPACCGAPCTSPTAKPMSAA